MSMNTKKLILSAAVFLTAGSALATDLPFRKAPPPPPPLWTGLFLGPSIGVGFGNNTDNNVSGKDLFCAGGVVFCTTPLSEQYFIAPSGSSGSKTWFGGGGQIGYNYQLKPNFVLGGVADIMVFDRSGDSTFTTPPLSLGGGTTETRSYSDSTKNNWLATFRLRAGPTFDNLWIYGTGGLALADLKASSSSVTTWTNAGYVPTTQTAASGSGSTSGVALGYVIGAGGEYRLTPDWSIFAEYLYYKFRNY
jgi:outer membrane immunogenic protein